MTRPAPSTPPRAGLRDGPAGVDDQDPRPLRSDAERNRRRVVVAAREVFAARGLGAGLNEVAHHAGVGVGTVYRRFATKEELVEAALQEPFDEMVRAAGAALAAPDAGEGLAIFLETACDLLADNLGLRQVALGSGSGSEAFAALRARFTPVADELIARAHATGRLDPGVGAPDVLVVLCMVTEVARHGGPDLPHLHRRYLRMLLDGARRSPDGPAGGPDGAGGPLGPGPDAAGAGALAARWTATG